MFLSEDSIVLLMGLGLGVVVVFPALGVLGFMVYLVFKFLSKGTEIKDNFD